MENMIEKEKNQSLLIFIGISIAICIALFLGFISSTENNKTDIYLENEEESVQSSNPSANQEVTTMPLENKKCYTDVCLQLRNHDESKKSFEIYMVNAVNVFGFQCDFTGIEISDAIGGLLKENEYQTSNSGSRLLSFSMQARPIPIGMGVLTEIHYKNSFDMICMTEILFAGIGGTKLSNDIPECLNLN